MRSLLLGLALCLSPTLAHATPWPSLSCFFTEPFVDIHVWPNAMQANHERREAVTGLSISGTAREPIIQAQIASVATTLTIKNDSGSDGMSDLEYPLEGKMTGWMMGTGTLNGGCVRFADGAVPYAVVGLSDTDKLTVRGAPSRTSRALGYINARTLVWVMPGRARNGWMQVSYRFATRAEAGPITIRHGWVRARYLLAVSAR